MTERNRSGSLTMAICVLIATIAVIFVNSLAAAGLIGEVTPGAISDKYPTVVTPAGYAFSIWSVIYLGLIVFSIYQLVRRNLSAVNNIRLPYLIACVLNCVWIFAWHYELIPLSLAVIASLLAVLFKINRNLAEPTSFSEFWAVKAPFSIYFGWITVATIANFAITIRYLDPNISSELWTLLGIGMIVLAASLAVIIRYRLANYLYPLAIAWALTAIGVKQSGHTLIVVAAALGTITCLIATLSVVLTLPDSSAHKPAS